MLTQNLTDLKRQVQSLLIEDGMGDAMQELEKALPPDSPKFNVLLQLKARLQEVNLKKIKHVISDEQTTLQYDQLRVDLLDFINGLQEKDFAADAAKKAKTGSVLYRIPRRMERQRETKCIVRLAFDEAAILQNIELTADVTLENVRVSEAMEVYLLDPRGGENFAIRTISTPEQFLEEDEYSEWIFYVTPLRAGKLPLVLKVVVLEQVGGRERKREIVLEEIIFVVSKMQAKKSGDVPFRHCGYQFTFSLDKNSQTVYSGHSNGNLSSNQYSKPLTNYKSYNKGYNKHKRSSNRYSKPTTNYPMTKGKTLSSPLSKSPNIEPIISSVDKARLLEMIAENQIEEVFERLANLLKEYPEYYDLIELNVKWLHFLRMSKNKENKEVLYPGIDFKERQNEIMTGLMKLIKS